MERQRSRRAVAKHVSQSPCDRSSEHDEKDHKQLTIKTSFRLRTTRWMLMPCTERLVSEKYLLLGILGIALLCLNSQNFPALTAETQRSLNGVPETPRRSIRGEKAGLSVTGKKIVNNAEYSHKPRSVGYYFESTDSATYLGAQRLDPNLQPRETNNVVEMTREEIKAQLHLKKSKDYSHSRADPLEEGDCISQYEWQKTFYPTCNTVHEHDLSDFHDQHSHNAQVGILNNGNWRDVWMVHDYKQQPVVVKTMRYRHNYEERNYDRHRRDAVAMERLSASRNVMDIFGFCGNSGVFEYASGGDLEHAVRSHGKRRWSNTERLVAAFQVAAGIADLHNIGKEGQAPIAHADISPDQFVYVDGHYKLNDFNRCRFLLWNNRTNETCPYHIGQNGGRFRSPEEYIYEGQTEKVDIYSMGNIFYSILTKMWPFEDETAKEAQAKVMRGERPPVPENILKSTEPEAKALLKAMEMSWIHDPKRRATAREVATYLKSELRKLHAPTAIGEPRWMVLE